MAAPAVDLHGVAHGRQPPYDLDAEAACLSAILLDRSGIALDEVRGELTDQAFYSEANRYIYRAACETAESGDPIDVVTVAQRLQSLGLIQRVGGPPYLAQITDATPAVRNVKAHANIVASLHRLRRALAQAQIVVAQIYAKDVQPSTQQYLETVEQSFADIAHAVSRQYLRPIGELISETQEIVRKVHTPEGKREMSGILTGFTDVDRRTSGMADGDLIYVAARPGIGKTSYALGIARRVAAQGYAVPFFSLEMPGQQLAMRLLSMESRIDLLRMRGGRMRGTEWKPFTNAVADLYGLPLFVDDSAALSVFEIRARCRRLQKEIQAGKYPGVKRLGPISIDYLQLMNTGGLESRANREQQIATLSRELKETAKALGTPVLALCQLNREVERRGGDKRPQLSDLRESGALEQDADVVQFLYRGEYYNPSDPLLKGFAEVIIAKQRNGPTGSEQLAFLSQCARFDNLEESAPPEASPQQSFADYENETFEEEA